MKTDVLPIGLLGPVEILTPDHSVRKHHKRGPSKLGYIDECPAFTSTDGSSEAAEQGTRLHEIMDWIVSKYKTLNCSTPLFDILSDYAKENPIDDDERSLLAFCIRELNKWLPQASEIFNETRVIVENPDGSELTHGSLDLLLVFKSGNALLIDLKFGWLPVMPAPSNLQGRAYALGALMARHDLNKIGVMFIQPKLGLVDTAVYHRRQLNDMFQTIRRTIDRAEAFERDPVGNQGMMKSGDYCSYCALSKAGTCPAKLSQLRAVATTRSSLPTMPSLDVIDTPEKAALARYWVELIEQEGFLSGVKDKAKEFAQNNGGSISVTLPDGEIIAYAIQERGHDRVLGEALEVAKVLESFLTLEEILGCADLSIGKLEDIGVRALYEAENEVPESKISGAETQLDALVTSGALTKTAAAKKLKEIKAANPRITKKEAKEKFSGLLEAHGVLSKPDGKIPVLKRQKNTKAITDKK